MLKMVKDLERGDLVELTNPPGKARVIRVTDRKLLPPVFQHYAGKMSRTVDFEIVDGPDKGKKSASQHHAEEQVEVVGHRA